MLQWEAWLSPPTGWERVQCWQSLEGAFWGHDAKLLYLSHPPQGDPGLSMLSAGCVQDIPEALSSSCFAPNSSARVSSVRRCRGHGAEGQQHVVIIQQMLGSAARAAEADGSDGSLPCY